MDSELKVYLDGKFADMSGSFAIINEKFAAIDGKFAAIDEKFTAIGEKFAAIDDRFAEVRAEIEKVETRLLSEFWKWGRSTDQRTRRIEHSDATTVERLATMEERIFVLERKAGGSKE